MVCTISAACVCTCRVCCDVFGAQIEAKSRESPFYEVSCLFVVSFRKRAFCRLATYKLVKPFWFQVTENYSTVCIFYISNQFFYMFCADLLIQPLLLRPPTDSCTGLISSSSTYGYCWIPGTYVQSMQWTPSLGSHLLPTLETFSLLQLSLQSHSWFYTVLLEVEDIAKQSSSLSP